METMLARRLSSLSKHVSSCITTCSTIRDQLSRGQAPKQLAAIEFEKLKKSTERLKKEIIAAIASEASASDELIARMDEVTQIQLQAEDLSVELDVLMRNPEPPTLVPAQAAPVNKFHSSLPKLQMAVFGGNVLRWTEFWDRFTSVVDRRDDIPDFDKLAYLLNSLEGEAMQAIEGLELTNKNYQIAVQKLKTV
uniref:Uncharacterized protein n=2 Tax=Cacopsylla melanoneura TaxID=428564 RepID=A0A8D8U056_9HEMI